MKPPREVTLGKIIRTLDGPLAPIGCVSQTAYRKCEDCPYGETATCPIQKVMLDVRNAIASVLDHYSLEDFANPSGKKAQEALNPTIQPVLRPIVPQTE